MYVRFLFDALRGRIHLIQDLYVGYKFWIFYNTYGFCTICVRYDSGLCSSKLGSDALPYLHGACPHRLPIHI